MAEPNLDELNVGTQENIMPDIADGFFKSGPVIRYMKENRMKVFPGGTLIQENYLYRSMKGGAYHKGANFNITRHQTKAGGQFDMRKFYTNVTEYLEDVEIELRSPNAVFDLVKVDMANAALTMSAILEIACFHHGQNLAGDDRSAYFNGLPEALNDGVTADYEGNTWAAYGNQTRVDVEWAAIPAGGQRTAADPAPLINPNVAGPINFHVLEHSYQPCVIGEEHPRLAVTTNRCTGYLAENEYPKQRFADTREPVIGWPGIQFKDAVIVQSQYCPGVDGIDDPDIGNYRDEDGETFWWLNPGGEGDDAYLRLWIAQSPKFQFGFTGFKVARDDTMVSGQILFSGNLVVRQPRLMRGLYGITA